MIYQLKAYRYHIKSGWRWVDVQGFGTLSLTQEQFETLNRVFVPDDYKFFPIDEVDKKE